MDNIKKFEDFIDKMQGLLDNAKKQGHIIVRVEDLENAFPELKESEDEKIRKEIIRYLKVTSPAMGENIEKMIAWLEKQGKEELVTCPICGWKIEKQGEQKTVDKVEPFDIFEGLTDFERTLADICIGWVGEELGWKQYIKDNADVLLKIAVKKFNSVQDAPFEQKSAWSEEDENIINKILCICNDFKRSFEISPASTKVVQKDIDKIDSWLKFLKDRVGCEVKYTITWKPSDEQLDALQYVCRNLNPPLSDKIGGDSIKTLKLMYKDLKKLRE